MPKRLKIDDKIIISLYNNGLTTREIAKKLKISNSGVRYRLVQNNIQMRTTVSYIWNKFNINYFNEIDTKEKAYWLGFLYADGYNNQKINKVVLALKSTDINVLELFKKHIEFEGDIILNQYKSGRKKAHMASIGLTSENFSNQLCEKGCFQKKSLKTRMPNSTIVPDELIWHFLRGILDGDGSIYGETNVTISICGGGQFIDELCDFLVKYDIKTHIYRKKKARYCNISNILDVIKFGEKIYTDSEDCRLERKYERFQKLKNYLLEKYASFHRFMVELKLINGNSNGITLDREKFRQDFTFCSKVESFQRKSAEKEDKTLDKQPISN